MAGDLISTSTLGDLGLLSKYTVGVVALVVTPSASTETTFAWTQVNGSSALTPGDHVFVTGSALSANLTPFAYCATSGTVTLRLTNASASTVTQAAATWTVRRLK